MKKPLLLGVLTALVLSGILPVAADERPAPVATVDGSSSLSPGALITVDGQDWPQRSAVLVELCGNLGSNSLDCDQPRSRTVGVGIEGSFRAVISAAIPPKPCPCVIRVTSLSSSHRYSIPVEVLGAPVAAVQEVVGKRSQGALQVDAIQLEPVSAFGEWFGRSPKRELKFRVTNTSTEVLRDVPVEVLVGSGTDTGRQVEVQPIAQLDPGAVTFVSASVGFDPLTLGRAELHGIVGRDDWRAVFEADTRSFPWGLLVILLVLLQVALVLGRNLVRRRLYPEPVAIAALPLAGAAGADGMVIDVRDSVSTAPSWVPPFVSPLVVPALSPPAVGTGPTGTMEALLRTIDRLRASTPAPPRTTAVVVLARSSGPGQPSEVSVRAAAFTSAVDQHPWVAPAGLEDGALLDSGGALSPRIIEAISGGRSMSLVIDTDTERDLASIAGKLGAELLSLPVASSPPADAAIAVALTATAGDVIHVVVVELPPGRREEPVVVLRSVCTA
jgi:hypothetical protein